MEEELVRFLDAGCRRTAHQEFDLGPTFGFASVPAEQGNGRQATSFSLLQCAENIAGVTACRDRHENIAGLSQPGNLPCEDFVVAVIIPNRAHQATALGEIERRIRPPVGDEATAEFRGEIRPVGRTPAIAADQQFSPGIQTFDHRIGGTRDRFRELLQRLEDGARRANRLLQVSGNISHVPVSGSRWATRLPIQPLSLSCNQLSSDYFEPETRSPMEGRLNSWVQDTVVRRSLPLRTRIEREVEDSFCTAPRESETGAAMAVIVNYAAPVAQAIGSQTDPGAAKGPQANKCAQNLG